MTVHSSETEVTEEWKWVFASGPVWLRIGLVAVSVATGLVLAAVVLLQFAQVPVTGYVVAGVVLVFLPVLALVDSLTKLLPNAFIHPAYVLAVLGGVVSAAVTGDWIALLVAGGYGVASFAVYFVIWFVSPAGGFGFGDVRLAGLLGFALGFHGPLAVMAGVLVLPVLLALPVGVACEVASKRRFGSVSIPFGPMMIVGACVFLTFPGLADAAVGALVT